MAFPASRQTLSNALASASALAVSVKTEVQFLRDRSALGSTGRESYLRLQRTLSAAVTSWDAYLLVPGIAAYAQSQYGDVSIDIAAEFSAMRSAALTLRNWIHG